MYSAVGLELDSGVATYHFVGNFRGVSKIVSFCPLQESV